MLTTTHNGAIQYSHSLDHVLEAFSKLGSVYSDRKQTNYYPDSSAPLDLFKPAFNQDQLRAMQLLFWARDIRSGAGNRSGSRECLRWVATTVPEWLSLNLDWVVKVGRWDDLTALYGTSLQDQVSLYWVTAILNGNGLAAKWADRNDKVLIKTYRNYFLKNSQDKSNSYKLFRKLVVSKTNVVETKMCENNWKEINYSHVPSKAMSLYTKAFNKHDPEGFVSFKTKVEKGEAKINTAAVFPHDLVRAVKYSGDVKVADLQFDNLPNYIPENVRMMAICDTSGSMSCPVGGSVEAVDVSMGLSLYVSDRLGKENPFYRRFIGFCDESKLLDWRSHSFSSAIRDRNIFNGAVGSTNIERALDTLLSEGLKRNVSPDKMPNILLILSDMQFNQGSKSSVPVVEACIQKWERSGYQAPKVVYWNLSGNAGSPATKDSKNVVLISGFSPAILKTVLSQKVVTPMDAMLETLSKYNINIPEGYQSANAVRFDVAPSEDSKTVEGWNNLFG